MTRAARPHIPGLLIGAPRSGSGKTTVTLGLQRALVRRGLSVRGLKCGPDYIDPAFHKVATGKPSANLDSFAMQDALIESLVQEAEQNTDLIVAEGSMGLFDGAGAIKGHTGASADIAALSGWPIVLVIDVTGVAQSAAAVALGFMQFDPRIRIAGVILNKVSSERHRRLASEGMAQIDLPIFGALPREVSLILPERYLGLVQAAETNDLDTRLDTLAHAIESSVDLDRLIATAAPAQFAFQPENHALPPPGQRIAIARDEAFSFLYPHLETGWRAQGASLYFFSPLADDTLPSDCDVCWLPGGYPELHAGRLASNENFLGSLRSFAKILPVHGECGGYMVLGDSLADVNGVPHRMLGLLPVTTSCAKRRLNLGYRVAELVADNILGRVGTILIGHEFHYASVISAEPSQTEAFAHCQSVDGTDLGFAGHRRGTVSGTFFHVIARAPSG
ncbi:MAG TPA: cobyrinate a,c-diamide synthase [Methylocella sp.]|nr:cobyrinate a,c-diamide synthase [Methylocella sp.]